MKPVAFHCFTKKQDIELFLPDFLRGFVAFGYTVDEDLFWAKKQCKNGPIYINISVINLGYCYSNIQIKTLYGNQKDVEKEVKQLMSILLSKGKKQVFPPSIVQKIINNNGKCGTKSILPTQRTTCSGRCLIPYEVVMNSNCNDEKKLRTFNEGLTINLINEDYFNVKEKDDDFSKYAIEEIGGEKIVSSMVSAMSVNGDSGSAHALKCFNLLESEIKKRSWVPLKRKPEYVSDDGKRYESLVTSGNDKIHGHYYVDVSGGNNKNKKNKEIKREHQCFIAYYDYANKEVALHINVKMMYELLHCFDIEDCLTPREIDEMKHVFETFLKGIYYDDGCLYDSHVMRKCLRNKN